MLTQQPLIHNHPDAIAAKATTRVMVALMLPREGDLPELEIVDLLLPNDGYPCRPKIDQYMSETFPGWVISDWWTTEFDF